MRRVRLSKTFLDQLDELLEQGYPRFGEAVVLEKRDLVFDTIERHLAVYPKIPRDLELGLCVFHVSKTPFTLLYDYGDVELRVHFVLHARADRSRIDPGSAQWE